MTTPSHSPTRLLALLGLPLLLASTSLLGQLTEPAASAGGIRPLLVGAEVPSVEVQTLGGETVDLRDQLGGKPTLLIFYRGGW